MPFFFFVFFVAVVFVFWPFLRLIFQVPVFLRSVHRGLSFEAVVTGKCFGGRLHDTKQGTLAPCFVDRGGRKWVFLVLGDDVATPVRLLLLYGLS